MKLYNTLTRRLEDFVPIEEGKVRFYHCGPTVYWAQHIGNLRGMTMGDILVRTFRFLGYSVTHVRNYTDVGHLTSDSDTGEDKMEKGARREGRTPGEIAQKYIDIFEQDTKAVNLLEPTYKPRPSLLIPDIISMVQTLMEKGCAYATDLAVYFDVSKFSGYTALSRQKIHMNMGGKGKGEVEDTGKRHFADFALWVFKAGSHATALQTWSSPFSSALVSYGEGFPGWHIECSVMVKKYLGDTIDIHMGGVEHIPIHHTNEIAQSESANGVPFVRYWLHNEHLVVDNEKMAKSKGTGLTIEEVVKKGYDPLALRYFYLTAQYRTRQNFTWEGLDGASHALSEFRRQVTAIIKTGKGNRLQLSDDKLIKIDAYRSAFTDALKSDLNTPKALAVVWEMLKSNIPAPDKRDLIMDFDNVLGLKLSDIPNPTDPETIEIPKDIIELVVKRDELRMVRRFEESDVVRHAIEERGYTIIDSPSGSFVKKKSE